MLTALAASTAAFKVGGLQASLTSISEGPIKMSALTGMGRGSGDVSELTRFKKVLIFLWWCVYLPLPKLIRWPLLYDHRSTNMLADNKEGGNKKGKELEKEGLDRILDLLQKAEDDKNRYDNLLFRFHYDQCLCLRRSWMFFFITVTSLLYTSQDLTPTDYYRVCLT